MAQEELGQQSEKFKKDRQCITGRSNCAETRIGGASSENVEKAGRKAGSAQSIENRQFYKKE